MTYLKTSVFALLALAIPAAAQEVNPLDRRAAYMRAHTDNCLDLASQFYRTEWCEKYRAKAKVDYETCAPVRRVGENGQSCFGGPAKTN